MPRDKDPRGSSRNRKMRKIMMLADPAFGGNGATVPCVHCGRRLDFDKVESDRISPGGPYAYFNVQPSCRRCNVLRGNNPDPRPFGGHATC